jgi:RNA polymerase sigma-70 factor (ECF subfamily)
MDVPPRSIAPDGPPYGPTCLDTADALLVRFADGDGSAFGPLYDVVRSRVHDVARAVVIDDDLAEEVTQDVMVTVWRIADRFDPACGSARNWVMSIARRHAVDRVRREQSARERDQRYAERTHSPAYDHVVETVEERLERQRVLVAVAALTPVQREAVELAYYGGYSHREVAELLEAPLGTVKTRLRDALVRLRGTLQYG